MRFDAALVLITLLTHEVMDKRYADVKIGDKQLQVEGWARMENVSAVTEPEDPGSLQEIYKQMVPEELQRLL